MMTGFPPLFWVDAGCGADGGGDDCGDGDVEDGLWWERGRGKTRESCFWLPTIRFWHVKEIERHGAWSAAGSEVKMCR